MTRRTPKSKRADYRVPSTTLVRSGAGGASGRGREHRLDEFAEVGRPAENGRYLDPATGDREHRQHDERQVDLPGQMTVHMRLVLAEKDQEDETEEIGRAHV